MSNESEMTSGIDWTNDEAVVRAVHIEARFVKMTDDSWRIYDCRSLFMGMPLNVGAKNPAEAWAAARKHPSVVAFEQQHREARGRASLCASSRSRPAKPLSKSERRKRDDEDTLMGTDN